MVGGKGREGELEAKVEAPRTAAVVEDEGEWIEGRGTRAEDGPVRTWLASSRVEVCLVLHCRCRGLQGEVRWCTD